MTTFQLKSGMNKGNRRIWIEGDRLSDAGFNSGITLSRSMNLDGTMTLSQGGKGHKVAGNHDRPIIDLCGKWVTKFMGNHTYFEVRVDGIHLHIRPVTSDTRTVNPTTSNREEISLSTADISSITRFVNSLVASVKDSRKPGDSKRAGRFRSGWKDATERNKNDYSESALSKVTWQNLGYRLGNELGPRSEQWINAAYEHIAAVWDASYFAPTSDIESLDKKSDEYEDLIDDSSESYEGIDKPPVRSEQATYSYKRDARVKGIVRRQAKGICELCRKPAPFNRSNGKPYLEVHHVVPLKDGGFDQTTNAVAICPNCHMRCHHSVDAHKATEDLYRQVKRLVRPG